ncbi:hypothetical protein RJ639_041402 [Escallonia herrerae]|uniref:Uncharacterized protein n=1 Tax=Escallonia herrerae TaxID=1293975 RepID=A0AA89B7R4_9ASTE|nr:hypothetical protein RJ639_041402 [Escallonia herrerae]
MDLWTVQVKNTTARSPISLLRNPIPNKPVSLNLRKMVSFRAQDLRVSRRRCRSFAVRAMGKKNPHNPDSPSSPGADPPLTLNLVLAVNLVLVVLDSLSISIRTIQYSSGDLRGVYLYFVKLLRCKVLNLDSVNAENDDHMTPEGGSPKGNNSSSESSKPTDTGSSKSHHKILDWREFRYILYRQEQAATGGSETNKQDGAVLESKPLGLKWAHPISSPEPGCVLVATEKLDGVRTFERTVVLLLRSGTRHPQEGPFGVVMNRPLHKKIKDMKPTNVDLATTFADCSLHFGGPLEASMFLQRARDKTHVSKFEEVIPGLCFGARNSLDEAAGLVKKGMLRPRDFRFFVGYAGWQLDQLREEIESDYWYVAACSANLIFGASSTSSKVCGKRFCN